jgi:hypothetical protein
MKKHNSINILILALFVLLLSSCKKEVQIPFANFTIDKAMIYPGENVRFTCVSTNDPITRDWLMPGATPSVSYGKTVSVYFDKPGIYEVTLTVSNEAGTDVITKNIEVIAVESEITIYNNAPTEAYCEVIITGDKKFVDDMIIPSGSSYTFKNVEYGATFTYYASVSGTMDNGDLIGKVIEWDGSYIVENDAFLDLDVSSDYFYLTMQNLGYTNLEDLYVNYGLTSETFDPIFLPNDGYEYGIGYYQAYNNTYIQMFLEASDMYVFWEHGYEFDFPWVDNQVLQLYSDLNKKKMGPEPYRGTAKIVSSKDIQTGIKKLPTSK